MLKKFVEINGFFVVEGRKLKSNVLYIDYKLYDECFNGLLILIVRYKLVVVYNKFWNKYI